MSLKKFLVKHSRELATVVDAVSMVTRLLPIGKQDRKNITDKLDVLAKASENISKSAAKMSDTVAAVDGKQLQKAVEAALPDLIEQIARKVFEMSQAGEAKTKVDEKTGAVVVAGKDA